MNSFIFHRVLLNFHNQTVRFGPIASQLIHFDLIRCSNQMEFRVGSKFEGTLNSQHIDAKRKFNKKLLNKSKL